MRPNIIDVAKYSGVSTATVSRVINNCSSVSASTREKVVAAIETVGYKLPERTNTKNGKQHLVVVLVPNIDNSYFSSIINGILTSLPTEDYHVILRSTQGDSHVEETYLDMLEKGNISGVISLCPIVVPLKNIDRIARVPWVICSNYVENSGASVVSIDYKRASEDAVLYLLSKGHKNIAIVSANENSIQTQQKVDGYISAMQGSNLQVDNQYNQYLVNDCYKSGELAARRLMMLPTPPTAILAASDTLAIGVMKAILGMNLSIPNDISVIGFDGTLMSEMFEPSITTINQVLSEIGVTSAQALQERINGLNGKEYIIRHSLQIRKSA